MYTMSSPAGGALHAVLVTVSAQWRPAPDSWLLVRNTGTRGDTGHHTGTRGDTAVVTRGHQRGPGMGTWEHWDRGGSQHGMLVLFEFDGPKL